jgi:D-glycero-D-manno-heptose 1,7-bisphosphate phosphatase
LLPPNNFLQRSTNVKRRWFVVLDRDGTIIEEVSYLSDPKQIALIPGTGKALRDLSAMGFGLVVITNQSAVGRGYFDEAQLTRIHDRFLEMLRAEDISLDGLYFCPHTPQDQCLCRKPRTGLIQRASEDLNFELSRSIVIGDKLSDIEMGCRVGAMTMLVRTGYGAQVASEHKVAPDYIVDDLPAAVEVIDRIFRKVRDQ